MNANGDCVQISRVKSDIDSCPPQTPFYEINGTCQTRCKTGAYIKQDDGRLTCLPGCVNKFIVNLSNDASHLCVDSCTGNYPFVYGQECREKCQFLARFVESGNVCNATCASGHYEIIDGHRYCVSGSQCTHYVEAAVTVGMHECVAACNSTYRYQDGQQCRSSCPFYVSGIGILKTCVSSCRDTNQKYFVPSEAAECLEYCPARYPFVQTDGSCGKLCPAGQVADLSGIQCMLESECGPAINALIIGTSCSCFEGYVIQQDLQSCQSECPGDQVITFEGTHCVNECTGDQQIINGKCDCASGLKRDEASDRCVFTCPKSTYLSPDERSCVKKCPVAQKDGKCLTQCGGLNKIDDKGNCIQNKAAVIGATVGPTVGIVLTVIGVITTIVYVKKGKCTKQKRVKQAHGLKPTMQQQFSSANVLQNSPSVRALQLNLQQHGVSRQVSHTSFAGTEGDQVWYEDASGQVYTGAASHPRNLSGKTSATPGDISGLTNE